MTQRVSLHISDSILRRARVIARQTNRSVEDVLVEWLGDYADNRPVDKMTNDEIVYWCNYEINPIMAHELRRLLNTHHETGLSFNDGRRLDTLLQSYRRNIIRKSRALQVAHARGLEVVPGSTGEIR
jgi:hypothetical protein